MLQCVAVCCSVLQCVAYMCCILGFGVQCVAMRYSVLQCVAVCCSVLHICVAYWGLGFGVYDMTHQHVWVGVI